MGEGLGEDGAGGDVYSLANYTAVYEETKTYKTEAPIFFLLSVHCSKGNLLDFYLNISTLHTHNKSRL